MASQQSAAASTSWDRTGRDPKSIRRRMEPAWTASACTRVANQLHKVAGETTDAELAERLRAAAETVELIKTLPVGAQ